MDKEYAKYLLEKTKEDYNLIAKDFSRTRSVIWEELKLLGKYISPGDKVLDLGCGNGRLLQILGEKSVEYFGIDNSEKLIKIAKEKYPEYNFQVADALNIPFLDNFFDKVYSVAVLHHIPSKEFRLQFLEEAKRVLKPSGNLILIVWYLWQKKTAWQSIVKFTFLKLIGKPKLDFGDVFIPWEDSQGKIRAQRYFHCFTAKELKKSLEKARLKVKEIRLLKRSAGHHNLFLVAEK